MVLGYKKSNPTDLESCLEFKTKRMLTAFSATVVLMKKDKLQQQSYHAYNCISPANYSELLDGKQGYNCCRACIKVSIKVLVSPSHPC